MAGGCELRELQNINAKRKNSILELLRFLFALWVLYYHSFVPFKFSLFGDGFLAVEFFFVLSGFFLVRSIDKYTAMPLKSGLLEFIKHRFRAIAISFIIGEIFVLIYSLPGEISVNYFFGYLWYIRDLFIAMTCVFLLRKYVKNERIFYLIVAAVSAVALFGFGWSSIMAWPGGPFRSAAAMPLGMLAALIPKISVKRGDKAHRGPSTVISAIGFFAVGAGCLAIIAMPEKSDALMYCLVILGYPALIYFASCIDLNCGFLNWLGSLSFPIYSFQCILRVIEVWGLKDQGILFIILIGLVLLFSLTTHLIGLKSKRCAARVQ